MDWLKFGSIILPDSSIGLLCEDRNKIAGQGIYYDRFEIQNTKLLCFVSNMITALNNNKIFFGCFGMYQSFVAGILYTAKQIHLFMLCNEELNYEGYIENCFGDKGCSVPCKSDSGLFKYRINVNQLLFTLKQDYF